MHVNQAYLKKLRDEKGWTQQQLAEIASVSLRTIQRVENQGVASNETVNALCAVYVIERSQLISSDDIASLDELTGTISIRGKIAYFLVFVLGLLLGTMSTLWVTSSY